MRRSINSLRSQPITASEWTETVANEEQVEILKKGVRAWNEWRIKSRQAGTKTPIDLAGVDLSCLDLSSIDIFTHLELFHGNLTGADLTKADLGGASLVNSDLIGANLHGANLSGADLWGVDLDNANLSQTLLYDTDFTETSLDGTDFSGSVMDRTIFANVDLRNVKGLESVMCEGPCSINIETIFLSKGKIPEVFLRGAGVPESLSVYIRSLVVEPIEYYSCFISYSTRDQKFAGLLHSQLRGKGARVWLATEDLKIGDRFRAKIDEAIRLYDKLLLVLSENSVKSQWVEAEVEAAFEKEQKQKRTVLFPIRLDDAVMDTEEAWAADIRRTRHIGDFRNWKDHDEFQNALERLLRDLKSKE
jgi:uncharacterized protein YjbI with pentapeptide repeats